VTLLVIDGFTFEADCVVVDARRAMPKACDNCPFVCAARGEDYLRPGRLDGIKLAVFMGKPFHCHKTTRGAPVRRWHRKLRQCRGALDWLESLAAEHGLGIETLR